MKRFEVKRRNSMAQNWDYAELSKAAVGASWVTVAAIKVVDYFKAKKKKNEIEIAKAKEEIINGIKEYDAMHPDEEGGAKDE